MNPYYDLANAVIEQAVKDYRTALKQYILNPMDEEREVEVILLECFFKSEWFQILSDLDGKSLMEKIRIIAKMEVAA